MQRWMRGFSSSLGVPLHPLGRFCGRLVRPLQAAERYPRGLVLVLPGIEGQSLMNLSIALGLRDGGVECAIEICDWTTGVWPLMIYHLRGRRRHQRQARLIAGRIVEYQTAWPGRPVHLVGHSGGGAMALMALEQLPQGAAATGAVLLAPAISPRYDLVQALASVEHGIWNFYSPYDFIILGAATLALGTVDGRHCVASGARGFEPPAHLSEAGQRLYREKLFQVRYRASMLRQFNLGGHAGCTNRVFVEEQIAPIVRFGTARLMPSREPAGAAAPVIPAFVAPQGAGA